MKIATSELEHLREEVKNCHRIIKDLQKRREFVGLTDDEVEQLAGLVDWNSEHATWNFSMEVEAKLKEKNT